MVTGPRRGRTRCSSGCSSTTSARPTPTRAVYRFLGEGAVRRSRSSRRARPCRGLRCPALYVLTSSRHLLGQRIRHQQPARHRRRGGAGRRHHLRQAVRIQRQRQLRPVLLPDRVPGHQREGLRRLHVGLRADLRRGRRLRSRTRRDGRAPAGHCTAPHRHREAARRDTRHLRNELVRPSCLPGGHPLAAGQGGRRLANQRVEPAGTAALLLLAGEPRSSACSPTSTTRSPPTA